MKTFIGSFIFGLAFVGVLGLTNNALADEAYYYVDTEGEIEVVMADSVAEALVEADSRATHSGVAEADESDISPSEEVIVSGENTTSSDTAYFYSGDEAYNIQGENAADQPDEELYMYVDIYGNYRYESADTPIEAIMEAELRAEHSGVMFISE